MKRWLMSLLALMLLTGCGASPSQTVSTPEDDYRCGVGDTLETENFEFSIMSVTESPEITNGLGVKYTASTGSQFMVVVFSAKNISDETQNVMNVNFNGYVDDAKITNEAVVGEVNGYMPLVGAVSADKYFEGYTIWELPEGWGKLEYSYIDALSGGESEQMTILPSDIEVS